MSMHKSLKTDKFKRQRRVHKRYERIQKLIRTKKWIKGMSVFGLPKEKILSIQDKLRKLLAKEKQQNEKEKEQQLDEKLTTLQQGKPIQNKKK